MSQNDKSNPADGFEEHKPSGKKGRGPTMKERLIAQRKAEAAQQKGASQPAAKPAPKAAPKPAPKAAPKAAAPKKVQPAAKRAAAPAAEAAEEGSSRPTRASSTRGGASRRSGGRASSSRRRGGDDEGEEEAGGGRGGRRRPAKKEKNMLVPALGTVAVLAVAGIGAWKFMGDDQAEAATTPDPNDTSVSAPENSTPDPAAEQAAADAKAAKEKADAEAKAEAEKAKAAKAAAVVAPEDMTEAPRNSKGRYRVLVDAPDNIYDPNDPAEPNLKEFEKFGKPEGCSDELWATLQEKALVLVDLDAGAAGTRAATFLEEQGKYAFPAMVNVMLDLDYGTQDGNLNGDFVQRTLMNLSNGRNADWAYGFAETPNKVEITNKRVVEVLYGVWKRVLDDPSYWDRYSATEAAKREKAGGNEEPAEPADDTSTDDLMDDLGIDD